jgi:hypothetical protein
MKYEKPEIVVLGSAVAAVQDSLAKVTNFDDGHEIGTPTAYSADEQ